MSDTTKIITEEDRRSALDAFANTEPLPVVIEQGNRLPGEARVFGAQRVAVKRDLVAIRKNLTVLAGMAGSDWFYRFPVTDRKGGGASKKSIEGPSIKLANAVALTYGNCDIDVRTYDLGDSWLFYARFTDLETGFSLTRPFQQRKGQTSLRSRDPQRAEDIAFQIGVSKAVRNVVVNGLQSLCDFAFEQARGELVKRIGKNLPHYREKIVERLDELDIDHVRVEAVVGKPIEKWLAPDMARVIAELQAVQDGMASGDDIWPEIDGDEPPSRETPKKGKPKQVGAAGQAPTLLELRTALWACNSEKSIGAWWQKSVLPWLEDFTPEVRKQLEAERDERLLKVGSSTEPASPQI